MLAWLYSRHRVASRSEHHRKILLYDLAQPTKLLRFVSQLTSSQKRSRTKAILNMLANHKRLSSAAKHNLYDQCQLCLYFSASS